MLRIFIVFFILIVSFQGQCSLWLAEKHEDKRSPSKTIQFIEDHYKLCDRPSDTIENPRKYLIDRGLVWTTYHQEKVVRFQMPGKSGDMLISYNPEKPGEYDLIIAKVATILADPKKYQALREEAKTKTPQGSVEKTPPLGKEQCTRVEFFGPQG